MDDGVEWLGIERIKWRQEQKLKYLMQIRREN
jgi:hypothetical protein